MMKVAISQISLFWKSSAIGLCAAGVQGLILSPKRRRAASFGFCFIFGHAFSSERAKSLVQVGCRRLERRAMQTLFPTLGMIAVLALIWGGAFLIRKGGDRPKGWLMVVAALVLFANILILTWPV
jgi:hypothetical protein